MYAWDYNECIPAKCTDLVRIALLWSTCVSFKHFMQALDISMYCAFLCFL